MPQELDHNKSLKIGNLPDKSTLYVKRLFTNNPREYAVVRRMKGDSEISEMILEDDFETIDAALNRAWYYFNMLNK